MGMSLSRFVKYKSAAGITEPTAIQTQVLQGVSYCFAADPQRLSIFCVEPVRRGRNFPNKFPLIFLMAVKEDCSQDQPVHSSCTIHSLLLIAVFQHVNDSALQLHIIDDGGPQHFCHKANLWPESSNAKIRCSHLVVIQ